jgi:hypothetical protein
MTVSVISKVASVPALAQQRNVVERLTLDQIVTQAHPGLSAAALDALRVSVIGSRHQSDAIPRALWHRIRPVHGATVVILVPPKLGAIVGAANFLTGAILNSLAAVAPFPSIAAVQAIYAGSVLVVGGLAYAATNALIPRPPGAPRSRGGADESYSIDGWSNQMRLEEPLALCLGRIRVAPAFASQPYTEIVDGEQYVRALLSFGVGHLAISDLRIGDIPFDDIPDLDWEVNSGTETDAPHALHPDQYFEETANIRLQEVGDDGVQWFTFSPASNATAAGVVLRWPGGLIRYQDNGDKRPERVTVEVQVSLDDGVTWNFVREDVFRERTSREFWRSIFWEFERGGTPIFRVGRTDDRSQTSQRVNATMLHAVQSYRPEYPINCELPIPSLAVRARASNLANGTLDKVTALVELFAPVWDGSVWADAPTVNPAGIVLWLLTGPANPFPVPVGRIDWDAFADWHDYCEANGLRFSRENTGSSTMRELLDLVSAAGRAEIRDTGTHYAPIIDRPKSPSRVIGPRNASALTWSRSYVRTPDAVRVNYQDEDQRYEPATLTLPWLGHTGPVDTIEEITALKGIPNRDLLAREVHRYMHEIERRRDVWSCTMPNMSEPLARGDVVALQFWGIEEAQVMGRVIALSGTAVTMDEPAEMEDGVSYGIQWEIADDETETVRIVTAQVHTVPGRATTLSVFGTELPRVGDLLAFGPLSEETEDVVVTEIDPGHDGTVIPRFTNAAPELDALAAAFVPPEYSPIRGVIAEISALVPPEPILGAIDDEIDGGAVLVSVDVSLPDTIVIVSEIIVEHRLNGTSEWAEVSVSGNSGTATFAYSEGDVIDIRAVARSRRDGLGPYADTIFYEAGSGLAVLPDPVDLSLITLQPGLGHAVLALGHADPETAAIVVYRTAVGDTFDAATDEVARVTVSSGSTVTYVDGDSTRADIVAELDFSGAAGTTVSRAVTLSAGATYRGALDIAGRTAGDVTVSLTGGAGISTAAISDNGQTLFALVADTGADHVALSYSVDFDGSASLIIYRESAISLPQGEHEYRFAAVNADDRINDPSGPLPATII